MLATGCFSDSPRQASQVCCGEGRVPPSESRPKRILTHNFGTVKQQRTLQHTFVVNNPTDRTVHFTREPDIGFPCCVELEVISDEIPPGGAIEVNVYFDTETRPGPFDVFIRLYPDSEHVPAHVHVSGLVKQGD